MNNMLWASMINTYNILKRWLQIYFFHFIEHFEKHWKWIFDTNPPTQFQDEENEVRPSGTTQKEEVQIEEPHDLKNGIIQEEEVRPKKPQDLRGTGQEEKEP